MGLRKFIDRFMHISHDHLLSKKFTILVSDHSSGSLLFEKGIFSIRLSFGEVELIIHKKPGMAIWFSNSISEANSVFLLDKTGLRIETPWLNHAPEQECGMNFGQ